MPIYAYRCASCGHAKDVLQKLSDPPLTQCPACGAIAFSKQVTAAGFQLKGSGWYATDFKGDKSAKKTDAGESAKTDAGKSEPSKTESTSTEAAKTSGSESKTSSGESSAPAKAPAKSGDAGKSSGSASASSAPKAADAGRGAGCR